MTKVEFDQLMDASLAEARSYDLKLSEILEQTRGRKDGHNAEIISEFKGYQQKFRNALDTRIRAMHEYYNMA